ncbi:MAG: sulfatase [Sedimentisphaerales bacterium]|nr:sulfatase [Sedimentisphaerales bacterium]
MKMTRRSFMQNTCAATAGLALNGLATRLYAAASEKRPNLLFVLADQLGVNHCGYAEYWNDAHYAGAQNAATPNLDRFAGEGVNFNHAVSNTPVCSAFRSTWMTGQHTTSHGMVINELRLRPDRDCLGHVLTDAGYETAYIGKWHLYANKLGDHFNPDNSFVPRGPNRLGFDGYWAAYNFHHIYYDTYYHTESKEKIPYGPGVFEPDGQTDLALRWLEDTARRSKRPFAAAISWGTPHDPWNDENVPAAYRERFGDVALDQPPNYRPANDPYADGWAVLSRSERDRLEHWRRNYYAMTTNLDWNFGRLMQYLEQSGLAENTIVVFGSDHGEMFGAQGRRAKNIFYDEAARIPFLIRWPGRIPAGRVCDACLSAVDIMPTVLGLMDLKIPSRVEGMNLADQARGQGGAEPEFAFLQGTGATANWQTGHEWRALRTKRHTYARFRVRRPDAPQEYLFDNVADPYQRTNLVSSAEHRTILEELRGKLAQKMGSLNDTFEASSWYRDHWTDGNRIIVRGARG